MYNLTSGKSSAAQRHNKDTREKTPYKEMGGGGEGGGEGGGGRRKPSKGRTGKWGEQSTLAYFVVLNRLLSSFQATIVTTN